jgi:hypothetical protein
VGGETAGSQRDLLSILHCAAYDRNLLGIARTA